VYIFSLLLHPKLTTRFLLNLEGAEKYMLSMFRILFITTSLSLLLSACSGLSDSNQSGPGAGNIFKREADSRNNENTSLGTRSITTLPKQDDKNSTLDASRAHYNDGLQMSRETADLIVRMSHVPSASVAVTNNQVYVAVDPDGHIMMMQSDQMHTFGHDPAAGAGLFGSGAGAGLDWSSAQPLPKETSEAIFKLMRHSFPGRNVYISSNPNFVNRMEFYDTRQMQGKKMGDYLNEFNTMVQYTFPEYANGTNRMLTK
jgi:hypothetical protein